MLEAELGRICRAQENCISYALACHAEIAPLVANIQAQIGTVTDDCASMCLDVFHI